MEQKHKNIKNLQGSLKLNKATVADLTELIRISPDSARIFFMLMAYADDKNDIITNISTICKYLNLQKNVVKSCLSNLIKNGYVELYVLDVNAEKDILGMTHDKVLYYISNKQIWHVIGKHISFTIHFKGKYLKLHINDNLIKCSNNRIGNCIVNLVDNVFYDDTIPSGYIAC